MLSDDPATAVEVADICGGSTVDTRTYIRVPGPINKLDTVGLLIRDVFHEANLLHGSAVIRYIKVSK